MIGFVHVRAFLACLRDRYGEPLKLCRYYDIVIVSLSGDGSMEADDLGLPTVNVAPMSYAISGNDSKSPPATLPTPQRVIPGTRADIQLGLRH